MKASIPTIAIFLLLVCRVGNNIAMGQTVGIEKTLQVFNVIFDTCNFDSRYYVVDSKPTFIILKEGPIIDMADSLGFVDDVLQLANGNKIVITSKGWMFMADLRYYAKLLGIRNGIDDMIVEFEFCEFDGFEEESHASVLFNLYYKNGRWILSRKKVVGQQRKE